MSKLIALKSGLREILPYAVNFDLAKLKQQTLLFDQIGFYRLDKTYNALEEASVLLKKFDPKFEDEATSLISSLQWLQEMGVIFEIEARKIFTDKSAKSVANSQKFENAKSLLDKILTFQKTSITKDNHQKEEILRDQEYALLRLLSIVMEAGNEANVVTTFPYQEYRHEIPNSNKGSIVQIVINNLPLPSSETPWEQILDFRNDGENEKNINNLRRWIRKIATENFTPNEIEDEIEWLLNEFEKYMKLHKMKANTETIEVITKAPLEFLSLKFSKIIDPLFAIKKRKINLLEAEMNAPGREMAYIINANETFQSQE